MSEIQRYRWMVLSRIVLAVVIGFAIASLSVAVIALIYPDRRAVATYTGMIASFVVWLIYIIYVFSVKSLAKAWISSGILLLLLSACVWGARQVGAL
ncbi:DUF3649 domain-containing protein [Acinetobacter pullicarnis]|uniref:DUF3649 domain-containing protein n=1 Tax=Acinetobacter pullicarnis TaxID=2576829 RepID=UPI00111ED717|nr:DUF3649 domain-containing protein [Acinetobacter pullicarnis]